MAAGVQQAAYVLARLQAHLEGPVLVGFDPAVMQAPTPALVIWEAFVSGKAKNRSAVDRHIDDARVAVEEFTTRLDQGSVLSDIVEPDVLNLAGAALLASGLTKDVGMLKRACVVVRVPDLHPTLPS